MSVERFRKVLYTPGDDAKALLDSLPALAQRSIAVEIYDPGECAQAMTKFEWDWSHNKSKPEWQIQPTAKP